MLDRVFGVRGWLTCAVFLLSALPAAAACDTAGAIQKAGGSIDAAATRAFYEAYGPVCAWDDSDSQVLISVLQTAGDQGLDPEIFHAYGATRADVSMRDVLLTDGALRYAAAMSRGLTGEPPPKTDLPFSRSEAEFVDGLIDALAQDDLTRWLDSLPPKSRTYTQLVDALRMYRAIDAAGGFPVLPDSLVQKSKRKGRDFAPLRQRLVLEGDLDADDGSEKWDAALEAAVTHFQGRNGLRADGKMTWKTLEKLNIPASDRVAQIALNLERLRVSERETPETRVEVNIPDATAIFHRNGEVVLAMNVSWVRRGGHETPTLTSMIDTVILNPTWTVPQSIIKNEIVPAIRRNKNYLAKNHMYWAGEQLVQEPGAHNALGRVKFDFPNKYSVYLHDTPVAAALHRSRARAEPRVRAVGAAARSWPRFCLKARSAGTTNRIRRRSMRARRGGSRWRSRCRWFITYRTAFVGEDKTVNFRADVYGWDTKLAADMAQKAAAMGAEPTQW